PATPPPSPRATTSSAAPHRPTRPTPTPGPHPWLPAPAATETTKRVVRRKTEASQGSGGPSPPVRCLARDYELPRLGVTRIIPSPGLSRADGRQAYVAGSAGCRCSG